jgi:alpha-galactosidase
MISLHANLLHRVTTLSLALPRLCCLLMALIMIQAEGTGIKASLEPSLKPSAVRVIVKPGESVVLSTASAEFDILPSGYIRAFLLRNGHRLTLDEPGTGLVPESVSVNGRVIDHFHFDLAHARVSEAGGKIGASGRRVELTGEGEATAPRITVTLAAEVYDDFPNVLVTTAAFKNSGSAAVRLRHIEHETRRLNASLADPRVAPYHLWSFQGSSTRWGKDDVFEISDHFLQANPMGAPNAEGMGGGIPVVAFWTASVGEAIGHLETLPLTLTLPVRVEPDQRIRASLELSPETTLAPGAVFSTPRAFIAVYHGDFFEPLRFYSLILQREGWTLPESNPQDYQVSWCGWGYESEVTPAQMVGTIPKLQELHIRWATLDDRWFNKYGDWEPRPDTFPGDAIRQMVKTFHQQGISVQIWWLPLGAEDGHGHYESHRYGLSQVVKDHPEWLILDQNGKPAHMIRNLAALCPAVPQVQEYYRQLTRRFIQQWDFDGHKLDNAYTVPPCYNPKHHHRSPQDSVNAVGKVYEIIFQTTRALKPQSVTQVCPCGTPPNLAWLPYLDQAVTADPVGSVQVRRRIKMYKALLGPAAAVYGDHVELTAIRFGRREIDYGRDFASTLGTGGVLGTKFVWPDPGPRFANVLLTPEKEVYWKKWIDLYDSKMLSQGRFLDLYTYGYDIPEGYAIEKNKCIYYAFYAPRPEEPWSGEVELRGLEARPYRITDYESGKDFGTVRGPQARVPVSFVHHLLLEADPE